MYGIRDRLDGSDVNNNLDTPNVDNELDHYDFKNDWMGPGYFMPNQCLQETSWTKPK